MHYHKRLYAADILRFAFSLRLHMLVMQGLESGRLPAIE